MLTLGQWNGYFWEMTDSHPCIDGCTIAEMVEDEGECINCGQQYDAVDPDAEEDDIDLDAHWAVWLEDDERC